MADHSRKMKCKCGQTAYITRSRAADGTVKEQWNCSYCFKVWDLDEKEKKNEQKVIVANDLDLKFVLELVKQQILENTNKTDYMRSVEKVISQELLKEVVA